MRTWTKKQKLQHSEILKKHYKTHCHHMKGIPKPEEQKKKMGEARKKYLERTDFKVLKRIYKKMGETKKRTGVHLGEKNSMYGKKRQDLSERNKQQWKSLEFRKKIREILSKTTYKGSQRQKNLYNYLVKNLNKTKINYNDWKTLNYKYELDISIPSKKIVIEWDSYRFHYEMPITEKRDLLKNERLLEKGWKFIRIKDNHLNKSEIENIHEMTLHIIQTINAPKYKHTGGFYIE